MKFPVLKLTSALGIQKCVTRSEALWDQVKDQVGSIAILVRNTHKRMSNVPVTPLCVKNI